MALAYTNYTSQHDQQCRLYLETLKLAKDKTCVGVVESEFSGHRELGVDVVTGWRGSYTLTLSIHFKLLEEHYIYNFNIYMHTYS